MKTIYKYQIQDDAKGSYVMMPHGAIIRDVGMQDSRVMVWAEVDSDDALFRYSMVIVGTGHDIPNHSSYVGTVHQQRATSGEFVWHIFTVSV